MGRRATLASGRTRVVRIVVTLWPHGQATVVPDDPMSPYEVLQLKMAWLAWQKTDSLAEFIEAQEKQVQISTLVFDWDEGVMTLDPQATA